MYRMTWPHYDFLKRTNGRWALSGIARRHVHLFLSQTWYLYIIPNMIYPFITQVCRRESQDKDLTMVLKITQQHPNMVLTQKTIPKHTQARLLKDSYYRLLFFLEQVGFFLPSSMVMILATFSSRNDCGLHARNTRTTCFLISRRLPTANAEDPRRREGD